MQADERIVTVTRAFRARVENAAEPVEFDAGRILWMRRDEYFAPAAGPTGQRGVILAARQAPQRDVDVVLARSDRGAWCARSRNRDGVLSPAELRWVGPRDQLVDERERESARRAAIIGAGRLGNASLQLAPFAGIYVADLFDADVYEEHSSEASDGLRDDVGRAKVDVAKGAAARRWQALDVRGFAVRIEDPEAVGACCAADLVVSAPDAPRARLSAGLAAVAALRPHVDVGTGVFLDDDGWVAGADVRLLLPTAGCILCAGGVDLARRPARDFRTERAGSLRSLNTIAAAQAMALVRAWRTGRLSTSVWLRLVVDPDGTLETEVMPWSVDPRCPLCSVDSGRGAAAFLGANA